ncbi:MAG: GIY-YIG nuclease family protein [Pantoea sp.]|uniref:GIY-YIG nuclease family protein n=1 Tax=Enterobacter agglomerans TaxID=549 RepID=UPI00290B360B|nr:GIY-YIG nuclease family protein [Pantoea sp.]
MSHQFLNKEDGSWIYVLMDGENINKFKVGKTTQHPVKRFKDIRSGNTTLAIQVAYFVPASLNIKLGELESAIHRQLAASVGRICFYDETQSEWFNGDARDAWSELDMILEEFGYTVTDYYQPGETKIVRFWGSDMETEYPRKFDLFSDNGEIGF